ncbi:ABC transporter ATP-binding protein [Aestuariimicrobium ganziense]|uniref:ABC transporter ATP-binding protein n=1 Tax=Aestuariimicrobium ganziense TaxID=2773677 RepID=UPI0038B2CEFF
MLVRLINRYVWRSWPQVVGVLLLQAVAVVASFILPTLNAEIIDNGVLRSDIRYIWERGGLMLGVSAMQVLAQVCAVWLGAATAMRVGHDIREAIFHRALSFSAREVNQFGAASLITRNTNDVQQVQQLLLMTLIMMVSAPMTMAFGVFMALREDRELSWVILVAVVVLGAAMAALIWRAFPLFGTMQTRIDTLNRVLREQITGIRVVRAFVREPYEAERFDKANRELTETQLAVGKLMVAMFPVVMFVMNVSTIAVTWFAVGRIDSGELGVGQMTAFITYLMQILMSVMMTVFMSFMVPRAAVSARRITEVLETSSSVVPPTSGVTDLREEGIVRVESVEFSYPGAEAPVLQDISFELRPGTTTAVIGSTGSGKTTLVNLLPRLVDATAGRITIDGHDVREIDPDTLWAQIGLVPQRAYLFSGTVASNLRYGKPDATEDEMWAALETAQAADFVRRMDGQLDARISQGGTNVSGGQRQRLSIARALVKKPRVYVFDDSFSALDVATDARLRAALEPTTQDAAVLIVAQRVSTIRGADQIVVLDDGHIVGLGRHEELLETCPTYLEIVNSQLSAEEAAA